MNSELNFKVGRNCRFGAAVTACVFFVTGCSGPSETTRDKRRLMDAVLTAVTIRNVDELSKDKLLVSARHHAGQLSGTTHDAILQIIKKAEAGDWVTAERELYELRKRVPFPG